MTLTSATEITENNDKSRIELRREIVGAPFFLFFASAQAAAFGSAGDESDSETREILVLLLVGAVKTSGMFMLLLFGNLDQAN